MTLVDVQDTYYVKSGIIHLDNKNTMQIAQAIVVIHTSGFVTIYNRTRRSLDRNFVGYVVDNNSEVAIVRPFVVAIKDGERISLYDVKTKNEFESMSDSDDDEDEYYI